jgi:GR25 family glycosyltransferase involved in LPS biosynthesis
MQLATLPVCRWRDDFNQDRYLCRSEKYVNAPNLVDAAFCAACRFVDHETPPPQAPPLPCVHLGEPIPSKKIDARAKVPAIEVLSCALHGKCTIDPVPGRQSKKIYCCAVCKDYLSRSPFDPDSATMLRQAEDFLAKVADYPVETYRRRGIIIAGGGDRFFPSLYITIRALRHLGCELPIQVWYLGSRREMPAKNKAILAPYNVECVDADEVRRRHPARVLGGWQLKAFATLHCPFEEVLFLDADCYPCRNPAFLFDLEDYRKQGAIFWPDMFGKDFRLIWAAFHVADPQHVSIESGQFVINKRLCWQQLNLAWFYNDHADYYYHFCYGDKHTFEVAWTRCGNPCVLWEPKTIWVNVAYLHHGPEGLPLFVHRCRDKFRLDARPYTTAQHHPLPAFYPALPMEKECWGWLAELAKLMGRTKLLATITALLKTPDNRLQKSIPLNSGRAKPYRVYKPARSDPKSRSIAVCTLYTEKIADLGRLAAKGLRAYARRHGYTALIADRQLDTSRHPYWSKLILVERYLSENPKCRWLMWLDADAVITNPHKRLEELIDEDTDFMIAEDLPPGPINAGVFLIRNCLAGLDLLRRTYAKKQYLRHPLPEQAALFQALRESASTLRYRIVPRRLFNSFAEEHRAGDFIKHFAGLSHEVKLEGVRKAMASKISDQSFVDQLLAPRAFIMKNKTTGPRAKDKGQKAKSALASARKELPPIFCITCRQTPQRTRKADEHFRERGLDVQFFPGIYGKAFGLGTVLQAQLKHRMLGGHLGAFLSHYMLWQTLTYLPYEEILILEDDAWFDTNFYERFFRAYADLPKDWQFVFVGGVLMGGRPLERITEHVGIMRYPCGMHAYLVKRSTLPVLLQTNQEARAPIDLQLMENSFPTMKCYTFTPSLVKQRSQRNSIDGTGEYWPTMANDKDDR